MPDEPQDPRLPDTGPVPVDSRDLTRRGPDRIRYNTRRTMSIREGRELARQYTMGSIKYRERIKRELANGTCHPMIEKAVLEIGEYFPKARGTDVHLNIGGEGSAGLLNVVLRRPLREDPVALAKPVEATVVESKPMEDPSKSILPTRRRPKSKAAPLNPDEEVMP